MSYNRLILNIISATLLFCTLGVLSVAAKADVGHQQYSLEAAPPWWADIRNDRADKIKTYLAQGASPNTLNSAGEPALMQAIREESWDVYEVLVNHPQTIFNAINVNRETALMYLAILGETERAQALIRKGAQINRPGWTPLHYAASKGQVDTAQMLLNAGAEVNALGPEGATPLMMAAWANSQAMTQLLLDAGADPTLTTDAGDDVVDWAKLKGNTKLANALESYMQDDQQTQASAPKEAEAIPTRQGTAKYFSSDEDFDTPITP